ncbi:uncharacterized protein [Lepeophtheirus salmonis]|uniref:uncharacterized protein isoform X1 n=2 Tax=Lepeophtheirus salmonis TaxID=72036 RepID=UPI003AF34775
MKNMTNIVTSVKYRYLGFDIDTPPLFRAYESNIYPGAEPIRRRRMSAEDKSETLSIVSSNRSTINISSDSTERMETPPIATSPPVTVTTNGIENKGFIEDEKKNVEFEAVNLELVDLNKSSSPLSEPRVYAPPPQTQPTVTQKFSDYYVSVNEHKKGLRGEKLYVTKDSRRGRGCKRYCCALLVLLVIAATVTIASLVGTGIIDTQPKFKGEINKSGRSRDLPPTNDSLISEPRPVIDNDFGDVNIEANEILPRDAVPNVLEGQMAIKNVAWDDRLSNSSNPFFKDMAQKVEKTLYPIFVSPMKEERADFFITVKEFERKDGVTPHYRVGWELKDNSFSDGLELITKDEISEMMMKHLKSNNGRLNNVFDVPMESIRVKRVADDKCDIMQCQSFCSYDYPSNDFKCGCSQSFMLAEDGRTCIEDSTDPTSNVNLLTAFGLPSDAENDQQGSFEVDTTVSTLETTKDETVSRLETTEDESVSQKSNIDIESDDYAKVPRFLNTSVDHDNGHGDHSAFEDEHHQLDDEWGNTEFPILDSFGEMVTINDSDLKNTSDHNNHENSQYDKNGSLQSHLEKGAHGKEHNGEIIHHNQEHEHGNIDQTWQSTQSNTEGNSGVVDQGLESLEENWNITSGAEPNNLINHNLHDPALDKLNTNGQNNQGNEQHENGFDPVFHGSNANEQNNPVNEHHSDGVDHSLLVANTNGQKNKENEEHSIGIDHTLNVSNTNAKNNEDKEEHKDGFDPTLQGSTSNGQNTTGDEQHENVFEPTLLGSNDNGLNNQGNEQPSDGVQPILQVSNTNTQNNEDNEGHKNGFEPALQGSDSNIQNTQGDEQHGNVFEPTLDGSNANDQNNHGDEQHINGVDHNLHSSNSNVDNIQGHDGHNNGVDPSLNGSNSNVQGNVGNENGFEPALNGSNSNDQNNQVLDKQVSVSFSSENESSKENQNENNNSVSLSQNTDDFEQSRISSDENTGHLEKEHEHDEVPKFSFSSRMNDSKEEESDQKSHHVSGVNHNKKHRNDHAEGLSSNEGGNLGINGSYEESADAESNNNSNEFNLNTEESNTYPDDKEGINQLSGSSQSLEDDVNSEQNIESSSSEPEDNLEDQINNLNNLKKSSNINGKSTILKEGNDKVNVVSSNPETNSNKDDREHPTTSENDSNSKEQIDTLVTAGTVDNLNKKSNTADNSGESSDTNEETDEANIQILGLASPLGKDLDEKEKNGKEFIQKQNETNINIVEKEDSRKITILEKSEDEIAHEDPKKVEHGSIHHISEKTENVNIHQGSEKKPNEKQSITFVHSAGNDQSVTDSSPFENNQSTKESSIEGHYHGDVFHAGFHEDDSFVDSDSRDHQFQSSTTDESNREDKVITEIFDSENSGLNDNGESNSSIDNDNGESNSSIDDKISSPTLQTLNVEDDATTSKTSSLNSTPAKRNSTLEGIDSKNVDTKEVLSDGITTQSTSFITDYSETQDVSPTETNVNEQTTEFAFENKINEGIGVTVSPNSKNDKVFEKKNVNEPENPNARTILESKDNLGREALDNKSQRNLDHGISQSDFVEDEGDKGPNIKFNTSDQNIHTQQSMDSDIINTFEGHNEKGDIIRKDEYGSLETDQSTEKIRDYIFNDILHKFASGVTNINIQPETKYNDKNKSNENKLDNSKNISQINEHIETIIDGTSGSTNEHTTTANPRNFDASDIVNKVGDIVIKSDNDKKETKFRISGSLGNENSLPNNETFNSKADISQENINSSNVFHVKDQNIFTNGSQLDLELIQKIILRNVLYNSQTNPFHQDSQPYQFGLQYPNGTEAVFNFNGTILDSSLIPTFILGNTTHENIKENIAILPNGQPIPNHQQQFQSASDEIADEKEVPSSSPGSNQVIFGGFQLPKGTPVNATSDLSTSFLSEFNPQIELNSKNDETSNPNTSDNPNQVIFGGFHLPNGTKIDLTSNIPN